MGRTKQKRELIKEQNRMKARRQRKLMLQFLGVGFLMFAIGVYVGNVYASTRVEQALAAAGSEENWDKLETNTDSQEGEAANSTGTSKEEVLENEEEKGQDESRGENKEENREESREENLPTDWNLLLVNGTHSLPEDFTVELGSIGSGHELDVRAVDDFKEMIRAARKDGAVIYVTSSYRTMEKQVELHQNKIEEYVMDGYSYQEAQKMAATVVAVPGTSEHQLGLAVDLVSSEYRKLDEKQETTKGFQWLKEHSWEYGFILRYPNGMTEITGIIYEPWHFRYVGKEAAKEITEQGITLEEYVGALPVSAASD